MLDKKKSVMVSLPMIDLLFPSLRRVVGRQRGSDGQQLAVDSARAPTRPEHSSFFWVYSSVSILEREDLILLMIWLMFGRDVFNCLAISPTE